jgi:hypothetical protein
MRFSEIIYEMTRVLTVMILTVIVFMRKREYIYLVMRLTKLLHEVMRVHILSHKID